MQERDFCYWLQGFFEISGDVKSLDENQIKIIKQHLDYVFDNQQPVDAKKIEEVLKPRVGASSTWSGGRKIC